MCVQTREKRGLYVYVCVCVRVCVCVCACVCVCVCVCVSCSVTLINSWPFVLLNDWRAITPTHKLSATTFPPLHTQTHITDTCALTCAPSTHRNSANTNHKAVCIFKYTERGTSMYIQYSIKDKSTIVKQPHTLIKTQTHSEGDIPAATS